MPVSMGWKSVRLGCFFFLTLLSAGGQAIAADDFGVRVPDGFEVSEFASDDLAHDIYSMTIDAKGRVVVAGAGYIKILVDKDGDGKADDARLYSRVPRNGAQGMYFLDNSLLCIGDGGLLRFRDENNDDQADGAPDVFLRTKTGGEHDVHSIQKGPDGWWYVIAGNNAAITERYASLPDSPIKQPRAGVVFRLKPDLSGAEVVAHGLRNAYDFAFNPQGDLFTYDSDEEREVSLPWYRPTRVFQVLPGADYGWVSKSWMRPDGVFDMPPRIASFGRGSPTGVVCYRHTQFPEKYRGGLFVLDWTYGRVHALTLKQAGETWTAEPETFMTAVGHYGFAPTDAEVGPDGSLYVSVGGRGTRGGVYRIRHKTLASNPRPVSEIKSDSRVVTVLDAPQPLSSWSRARWVPLAQELGSSTFQKTALETTQPALRRIRAIEILTELFEGLSSESVKSIASAQHPEVRARAIWAYGRLHKPKYETAIFVQYLDDSHPLVRRAALEACQTIPAQSVDWNELLPALSRQLGSPDRFNRWLASRLIPRLDENLVPILSKEATKIGARAVVSYAHGWLARPQVEFSKVQSVVPPMTVSILKGTGYDLELKRDAARLLQIALGDMGPRAGRQAAFDGYGSRIDLEPYEREFDQLRTDLAGLFPTGDSTLDRELLRLLAMLT